MTSSTRSLAWRTNNRSMNRPQEETAVATDQPITTNQNKNNQTSRDYLLVTSPY